MNNNLAESGKVEAAEYRQHDRYAVHWPVVIIYKKDGKDATFRGRTYDLSLGGACIYTEHNIYVEEPVVMSIKVDANHHSHKVIGVKCCMLYSILASDYGRFRIGIQFIEFNGDGKKVLTEALSRRPVIKDEGIRKKEIREEEIRAEKIRNLEIRNSEIKEKETKARMEREIRARLESEIRTRIENEMKEKEVIDGGMATSDKSGKYGRMNDE